LRLGLQKHWQNSEHVWNFLSCGHPSKACQVFYSIYLHYDSNQAVIARAHLLIEILNHNLSHEYNIYMILEINFQRFFFICSGKCFLLQNYTIFMFKWWIKSGRKCSGAHGGVFICKSFAIKCKKAVSTSGWIPINHFLISFHIVMIIVV
jgi:hypothetical protein